MPEPDDLAADLAQRRSASARRSTSARERPSCSMRSALAIAAAAWSAGPWPGRCRVAEGIGAARERAHRPERPVAADEGRHEHRLDRQVADEAVGVGEVDERGSAGVSPVTTFAAATDWPNIPTPVSTRSERTRPTAVVGDPSVGRRSGGCRWSRRGDGHRAVGPEEAGGPSTARWRIAVGSVSRASAARWLRFGLRQLGVPRCRRRTPVSGRGLLGARFDAAGFASAGLAAFGFDATGVASWRYGGRRCALEVRLVAFGLSVPFRSFVAARSAASATRRRRPARRAGRRPA